MGRWGPHKLCSQVSVGLCQVLGCAPLPGSSQRAPPFPGRHGPFQCLATGQLAAWWARVTQPSPGARPDPPAPMSR